MSKESHLSARQSDGEDFASLGDTSNERSKAASPSTPKAGSIADNAGSANPNASFVSASPVGNPSSDTAVGPPGLRYTISSPGTISSAGTSSRPDTDGGRSSPAVRKFKSQRAYSSDSSTRPFGKTIQSAPTPTSEHKRGSALQNINSSEFKSVLSFDVGQLGSMEEEDGDGGYGSSVSKGSTNAAAMSPARGRYFKTLQIIDYRS